MGNNLCPTCYVSGSRKRQDEPRRKHSYAKDAKKKSIISNTVMGWSDVPQISHEDYDLRKIMNEDESKSTKWRQRSLSIDRFSLLFFPLLFAAIMAMYGYVYLSG